MTFKEFAQELDNNENFAIITACSLFGVFLLIVFFLIAWSVPDTNCSKEEFKALRSDVNAVREKVYIMELNRAMFKAEK
jgi:hypothetical protein